MTKLTDLYNTTETAHLERIENLIRQNFTPNYYVALHGGTDAEADPTESYYNVADNEDDFITDIHEWIGCLAIKDGVDAVRYNNGNFGFVAYYSGHSGVDCKRSGKELLTNGESASRTGLLVKQGNCGSAVHGNHENAILAYCLRQGKLRHDAVCGTGNHPVRKEVIV